MSSTAQPGTGYKFDSRDLKPGVILTHEITNTQSGNETIRCRVDRVEHGAVYMSVMDGKTFNNETEFSIPVNELANLIASQKWLLLRKAA